MHYCCLSFSYIFARAEALDWLHIWADQGKMAVLGHMYSILTRAAKV